jgi:hypothetical protein
MDKLDNIHVGEKISQNRKNLVDESFPTVPPKKQKLTSELSFKNQSSANLHSPIIKNQIFDKVDDLP